MIKQLKQGLECYIYRYRAGYMLSHTTISLKIYNVVGIRHFAKRAETSEGSASNNFKGPLIPTQIEPGKKRNNNGRSNHTLSENSPTP